MKQNSAIRLLLNPWCWTVLLLAAVSVSLVELGVSARELEALRLQHASDLQAQAELEQQIDQLKQDRVLGTATFHGAARSGSPGSAADSSNELAAASPAIPSAATQARIESQMKYDLAMHQALQRLDQRGKDESDPDNLALIQQLRQSLVALDDLRKKIATASDPAERQAALRDAQPLQGKIIQLTTMDRNEQIAKLAKQMGYTDETQINQLILGVDKVYRDTAVDWTKFFGAPPGP
jgi:hypothetical protein